MGAISEFLAFQLPCYPASLSCSAGCFRTLSEISIETMQRLFYFTFARGFSFWMQSTFFSTFHFIVLLNEKSFIGYKPNEQTHFDFTHENHLGHSAVFLKTISPVSGFQPTSSVVVSFCKQ